MHLTIEKNTLLAGISTVIKAMSARTPMNVLEGIYLECKEEQLLLRCSDLSLQIDTVLEANILEDGYTVLPGRLFSEYVRKLPDGDVEMTLEGALFSVRSGRSKSAISVMSADEFPLMNCVGENHTVQIRQLTLKNMIRQTVFATAQDESKPVLTGALLQIEDGLLTMVALDGFRLAIRTEGVDGQGSVDVVVPGKSLLEILRTLNDSEDFVNVRFSQTHIQLDMGYTIMISRLIEGKFIPYSQILPQENKTRVRINRVTLLESIERASLIARESKNNIVKFSFKECQLDITANSEMGNVREEIGIELTGHDLDIAFNARYFTDVLKNLEDEELFMEFNNNVSPCVVRPIQNSSYIYLILPVRLLMN